MHFETKAIHAGAQIDGETGAVAPPIHLSTTFERRADDGAPSHGYSYIRDHNPTQTRLEEALAAIDSGAAALAFSSGMAAASCLLQALPRDAHVILPGDGYYAVRTIASDFFPRWGLTHTFADFSDLAAVERAVTPQTRAIWAESPSNPLMNVCDLAALARIAHGAGAMLVVDGTFATPALQRPIEIGADVVLHSTTKYLGGHSDVHGGALAFARRDATFDAVEHARTITGGVASPFSSWLVLRGIRSLAARMRVHCENAMAVARFLAAHPRVEAVHYPGLESHPGHEIAARQMSAFGGMMSFLVRDGREAALGIAAKTKVFIRATSLGGIESLVEHRQSSEGPGSRTAPNLLRMSIGLEHSDDLIDDLRQALE
jgi:cystathionine gamma-synthase